MPGTNDYTHPHLTQAGQALAGPRAAPWRCACGVKTILVVEGQAAVREMVSIALGRQGHSVIQAAEAAEALAVAVCTDRPIHLVVADLLLPRGSARALVEGLIELGLNLPVLYLSDY